MNPNPPPPPQTTPLDATGSYQLDSSFDVVSGMPGNVGDVLNKFIDMTDDPYDPATWILDQLVANVDNGTVRSIINAARPALDGILYQAIQQNAPDLVNQLVQVGDDFGQVAKHFGTISTLDVKKDAHGLVATHTVTGYQFFIDNAHYQYDLSELGSDPEPVTGIRVTLDGETRMNLAEENIPLQYGGFLALALNQVIIPAVDPQATNLDQLLNHLVPCDQIGAQLADQLGFGSASFYSGLCQVGLQAGANALMDKLIGLDKDSKVTLVVTGTSHITDKNSDRKVDTLTSGKWNGHINYLGKSGDMAQDVSTFTGGRQ